MTTLFQDGVLGLKQAFNLRSRVEGSRCKCFNTTRVLSYTRLGDENGRFRPLRAA